VSKHASISPAVSQVIAIRDLVPARNIRYTAQTPEQKAEMKASIRAKGVIQNLCGAPRASDGKIAIFAGLSRYYNCLELISDGYLPYDFSVEVKVYHDIDPESAEAIAIAMTENMIRAQMDYVDECAAMLQLAEARIGEEEIAAIFGYAKRTVIERLLIAKLIPEAHALMRDKIRNLGWGRALTLADASMQKQICDDIASNPDAWKTGDDIRKHLLQATIPLAHAIFDASNYKGGLISDMFEGDKITDIEEFWILQNQAIKDLSMELEAEGFMAVTVLHEPFQAWRYEEGSDPSNSCAFIEVKPTGKVTVIRNQVPIDTDESPITVLEEDENESVFEEIAVTEVRATPSLCTYAAAQRSAILQVTLSSDFRMALQYSVLAMLGHRSASFSALPYSIPGNDDIHNGDAFRHMSEISNDIATALPVAELEPDQRERELVAMVRSMDDASLQTLFTNLTAERVGQQRLRGLDDAATSLTNVFCADVDIRSWWMPDEAFFRHMAAEDLRRLAAAFLPGASSLRFAHARKSDLVKALADNFSAAKDGALSDPDLALRLNTWVPGIMSFPAKVTLKSEADALFDAEGIEAENLLFTEA